MKYVINEKYSHLEKFLLNIKEHFSNNNDLIHDARNQLKVITFENYNIVVKSFKVPHALNQVVYSYFRDSKAKKSYENSLKLLELGVHVPEPIGYIEFYDKSLFKESFFLSIELKYDFTIREVLHHEVTNYSEILAQFTKFTYALHQKGVWHVDYSLGNILIKKVSDNNYEFYLVDINRMLFKDISPSEGCKNFNKLWAQDDDYKIIAKQYSVVSHVNYEQVYNCIISSADNIKKKKVLKNRFKNL